MLRKRIIPCLDVSGGRVVKGVNFVNLRDCGEPVEAALRYAEQGADEIVWLNITATGEDPGVLSRAVERAAEQIDVPLTVGGGVGRVGRVRELLLAGADKVSLNTAAVDRPDLVGEVSTEFGAQCVVVAIDSRRTGTTPSGFEVYIHGGRTATGRDVLAWASEVVRLGAGEIMLTSMDRDGTRDGFDLELTRSISDAVGIPVIASGGVGTLEHLVDGVVDGGADAVLAASIFHYGEHTIAEAKALLAAHGVTVRT